MHFSRYIKQFSYAEDPDYTLLYSTKRGSAALVSKALLATENNRNILMSDEKALFDIGFIVENPEAEKAEMIGLLSGINTRNRQFHATVILNLACNLDCVYCYEGDLKGRFFMSRDTADRLVAFITDGCDNRIDDISIMFYGGEPLLSIDLIKHISERLRQAAEAKGAKYSFGLTTNGTLLTGKLAGELTQFGLNRAFITLDGSAENHNKFRPFASGTESFDIIMRNIKEICGLIEVNIGGNYTRENYREFPALLDYLITEGLTPDRVASIAFNPVTSSQFNRSEYRNSCSSINEPWLFEAGLFLREEILKKGFKTKKVDIATCKVEINNSIVVNYDGSILKCPAFMGYPGLEAGNLTTGIKDFSKTHNLDIWKREECLACEYLPICFGGCRFDKLLRDGNIDGVDCKKPYLDATLETLVKQDLKYRQKIGP